MDPVRAASIGPNCVLASPSDAQKANERSKLLTKSSEENKVNLFYLRDVLLKRESHSSSLLFEKTNALSKLKRYSHLQVF